MTDVLVLTAHGTRDPNGPIATEALADAVADALPSVTVRVAYADVRAPSVAEVLAQHRGRRTVVVPAFLAAGYHVRSDLPEQIAASGHRNVVLADHFGPAPELIAVAAERVRACGYRISDRVVLAAAGSGDARALVEVDAAAYAIGERIGAVVRVGYAAGSRPSIADAVDAARASANSTATADGVRATPTGRVAVASWLLAPGLFQRRCVDAGADVIASPLGVHPHVIDLVVRRYAEAGAASAAA